MLPAVELNDQATFQAHKIDDERTDTVLTAKLEA
jgi:hypothetical protein